MNPSLSDEVQEREREMAHLAPQKVLREMAPGRNREKKRKREIK
jgi:hypothetical protein